MDGISLAASIITLLGAAKQTVKILENVRAASAEVHALLNEVSNLQAVCYNVRAALDDISLQPQIMGGIAGLLQQAEKTLLELNKVIHYDLIEPGTWNNDGKVEFGRLAWLQKRSKINRLRQQMRTTTKDLDLAIASMNSKRLSRIRLQLHQTSIVNEQNSDQLTRLENNVTTAFAQNESALNGVSSSLAQFSQVLKFMQHQGINAPPQHDDQTTATCEADHDLPTTNSIMGISKDTAFLSIQANVQYNSQCRAWCNCACHIARG